MVRNSLGSNYKSAALPAERRADCEGNMSPLNWKNPAQNAGIALLAMRHLRNAQRYLRYPRRCSYFRSYSCDHSSLLSANLPMTNDQNGGKGIRTPDFQLAKLALYQLSYAPVVIVDFRLWIADCKCEWRAAVVLASVKLPPWACCVHRFRKAEAGCRSLQSPSGIPVCPCA